MVASRLGSYQFRNSDSGSEVTILGLWNALRRETSAHGLPNFSNSGGREFTLF